jgi:hypothetical protein
MRSSTFFKAVFTVAVLFAARSAYATPINADGTWNTANCSLGIDCDGVSFGSFSFPGSPPWTFNGAAIVAIVDALLPATDQYALYDFGSLVGFTSASSGSGDCGVDPDAALLNADCGKGAFSLGGGTHSMTIQLVQSQNGASGVFFKVEPVAATEPASVLLLLAGLAGLRGIRSRKEG